MDCSFIIILTFRLYSIEIINGTNTYSYRHTIPYTVTKALKIQVFKPVVCLFSICCF